MSKTPNRRIARLTAVASVIALLAGGTMEGGTEPASAKTIVVINKVAPKISGKAEVGQTLTATLGTWTGAPKLSLNWATCTIQNPTVESGAVSCSLIPGAVSSRLILTQAQVSSYVAVIVKAKSGSKVIFAVSRTTSKVVGVVVAPKNFIFDNGIRVSTGLRAFTSINTATPPGVPIVKVYFDFQSEGYKVFQEQTASVLETMASSGKWIVEYHPLYIPGRAQSPASRMTAVFSLCVAEVNPDLFAPFSAAMLRIQPKTPYQILVQTANNVGIANPELVSACEQSNGVGLFNWLGKVTSEVLTSRSTSQVRELVPLWPAIVVGDQVLRPGVMNGEAFAKLVNATWQSMLDAKENPWGN